MNTMEMLVARNWIRILCHEAKGHFARAMMHHRRAAEIAAEVLR